MPGHRKTCTKDRLARPKKGPGKILVIAVLAGLLVWVGYRVFGSARTVDLLVGDCPVKAEIADTSELQAKGLSGRKRLKPNHGMLFVNKYSRKLSFWMKDTSIPLSIAFIAHDGTIRQIEQMNPLDLSLVTSDFPVQYALEMNQGFFEKNGIVPGMRIDLTGLKRK